MEKIVVFLFAIFYLSGTASAHTPRAVGHLNNYPEYISLPDTTLQKTIRLTGKRTAMGAGIEWSSQFSTQIKSISIQTGTNGKNFTTINTLQAASTTFTDQWSNDKTSSYYRVEVTLNDGSTLTSNVVLVSSTSLPSSIVLLTNPVADVTRFKIINCCPQLFMAEWRNSQGTMIETQSFNVSAGNNRVELVTPASITPGTYYLRIVSDDKKQRQLFRVMKQ